MSRLYSNDEALTAMANELEFISFAMSQEDIDYFKELERNPPYDGRPINVFPYPGHGAYRVRLCLGGKVRTIGITKNGPNAARFADMAKLFFWPFRLRAIRFACDADFNYGLKATEEACHLLVGENEVAMRLLDRIKEHLIETGALKLRTKEGAKREDRRTVRSDVNARFETQERLICALSELVITQFHIAEKQRTEIQEQLGIADKQHVELRDVLRRIEKQLPRKSRAYYVDEEGAEHPVTDCPPLERLDYTPEKSNTPEGVCAS